MTTKNEPEKLTDPDGLDHVHCDQFGIDHEGKPIADNLTGTGSDAGLKAFDPDKPHKMPLTQEEQNILNGSQGPVMAKVLKTIVMHGELFGAERLADCGGTPHSSLYTGGPWVTPVLEMFEEIADAGLKAFAPYTVNPMPLDLYSVGQDPVKRSMELEAFPLQGRLIGVHTRLGAVPLNKWSCARYLPEVGNTAEPGTVVTWAESSAVNYGNSVLGLRINRMATGMEILCGIAGKVPVFGVLTDEGRKAKWHIDVRLSEEPHWGALGGAIGTKVVEQIPYITGIDQWIGMKDGKPDLLAVGKLKAMGSTTASSDAVGLYHVENVTPEAIQQGRDLLVEDYQTYVIDDDELARVRDGFPNLWKDPDGDPTTVYIGCPHNTYGEMVYWTHKFHDALKEKGQEKLAIPVVMASSPVVKDKLLDEHPLLYRDMIRAGIQFTTICTPAHQGLRGMADIDRGVTNSNKARFYSMARLYDDDDLVELALTGRCRTESGSDIHNQLLEKEIAMSKKTFRGRVVLSGKVNGKATVSKQPFNTTGSYQQNMWQGKTDAAPCTDASNKELFKKDISDAIICTPTTVGSTMGGMVLMGMTTIGVGPKALLFSNAIDTLAAAGVIMAEVWKNQRIVTIDMLGDEFLETVEMDDPIAIHEDGTVEIG